VILSITKLNMTLDKNEFDSLPEEWIDKEHPLSKDEIDASNLLKQVAAGDIPYNEAFPDNKDIK